MDDVYQRMTRTEFAAERARTARRSIPELFELLESEDLRTRFVAEMCLRDGDVRLGEGEFAVIPRGVEHKPYAEEEAHVLLFEPKTVLNTGDVVNEMTRPELERV